MKTVKLSEFIHAVTYSCQNITLCNKPVPKTASFVEKKNIWEISCPTCKQFLLTDLRVK